MISINLSTITLLVGCKRLSTFSNTNPSGPKSDTTLRYSFTNVALGSFMPRRVSCPTQYPAFENGWHGAPPITINLSCSRLFKAPLRVELSILCRSPSMISSSLNNSFNFNVFMQSVFTSVLTATGTPAIKLATSSPPAPENKLTATIVFFILLLTPKFPFFAKQSPFIG